MSNQRNAEIERGLRLTLSYRERRLIRFAINEMNAVSCAGREFRLASWVAKESSDLLARLFPGEPAR